MQYHIPSPISRNNPPSILFLTYLEILASVIRQRTNCSKSLVVYNPFEFPYHRCPGGEKYRSRVDINEKLEPQTIFKERYCSFTNLHK